MLDATLHKRVYYFYVKATGGIAQRCLCVWLETHRRRRKVKDKLILCVLVVAMLGVTVPVQAIVVTQTADDGFGTSSFDTAGTWDDPNPPSGANDYFNGGFLLRTPPDASDHIFQGNTLTITGSGLATGVNNEALMWKGSGTTAVITVTNLTVDGGQLRHGQGDGDSFELAGDLTVGANGANMATQGGMDVSASIAGSTTIRILPNGNGSAARTITFSGGSNTFTGDIELYNNQSFLALGATGNLNFVIGASGVNNSVLEINAGATVTYDGEFDFDLSGAGTTLGDNWTITSVANTTFGASFDIPGFTESSDVWTNGIYQFEESTGVLSVIPEPASLALMGIGGLLLARRQRD